MPKPTKAAVKMVTEVCRRIEEIGIEDLMAMASYRDVEVPDIRERQRDRFCAWQCPPARRQD
ncbi:MAG: hypothetical protein AAGI09_10855 [Pseudomonadota bacterium]